MKDQSFGSLNYYEEGSCSHYKWTHLILTKETSNWSKYKDVSLPSDSAGEAWDSKSDQSDGPTAGLDPYWQHKEDVPFDDHCKQTAEYVEISLVEDVFKKNVHYDEEEHHYRLYILLLCDEWPKFVGDTLDDVFKIWHLFRIMPNLNLLPDCYIKGI